MEEESMIFADKLIELRKRNGWSQEDLAQQMDVSRQSVSKWEGAQSIPDMNKLIKMSELFGVSLDCLLKDEQELTGQPLQEEKDESCTMTHVSMEEARAFLNARLPQASRVALGVMLCVLSPVALLLLGAYSELPDAVLTENQAGGIGLTVLLLMVAAAVTLFLMAGNKLTRYTYLDSEVIDTAYGVSGMVKEEMEKFRGTYNRCNVIGVVLCICAAIPLFAGQFLNSSSDMLETGMLCITLGMVSVAVYLFVWAGSRWGSYQRLLQEGEYSVEKKTGSKIPAIVSGCYWILAAALFLLVAFVKNTWGFAGGYWAVAGVSFPVVYIITYYLANRKNS